MAKIGLKDLKTEIVEKINSITGISAKVTLLENKIQELTNEIDSIETTNCHDDRVDAIIDAVNTLSRAIANIPKVPTKVSELQNDAGYITSDTFEKLNFKNPNFTGTATVNNKTIATIGDIPTSTSALKNDSGYLTSKDINIDNKADKATAGYNKTLDTENIFPFVISGDDKIAGVTFKTSKHRVNFGLDENNKLCLVGGTHSDKEIIITDKDVLTYVYENGVYLMKVTNDGTICITDGTNLYDLVYDEVTKKIILKGRE